ncbi:MAG: threonine/serine dehydratase [Bacteroidetes bacterium]|nr:MAG: threonine/serine dehydratase [Bacteroidota bacterium]
MENPITKQRLINTHNRIREYIHNTPVLKSEQINNLMGCDIVFKCENFQKVGAFKSRGAMNAVLSLHKDELIKGVCTHSSGNHAQALARAAKIAKIPAYIVMPINSSQVKINAVKNYGAEITFCESNLEARETTLNKIVEKTGATFIHPYNNWNIIAGQATATKELLEEYESLNYIIAPVGGGGLLSGTALSAFYFADKTKVIGAEPSEADDAYKSFENGKIIPSKNPNTIADGLLTSLGDKTFSIIQQYVDAIMLCDENSIIAAMKLVFERMKIVIEPSSAAALAIIMENKEYFKNKQVGIIISGGNVDLDILFNSLKK